MINALLNIRESNYEYELQYEDYKFFGKEFAESIVKHIRELPEENRDNFKSEIFNELMTIISCEHGWQAISLINTINKYK